MSLSILTRPVVDLRRLPKSLQAPLWVGGKHVIRQGVSWIHKPNTNPVSRFGHSAVTDSLLSGLELSGHSFKYNPLVGNNLTWQVGVLAGAATLASALELVHAPELAIMAGPNITTAPSEISHLYTDERVRLILVPSTGVARAYEIDLPGIAHKVRVWPAGVDTEYWTPRQPTSGTPQVVLYIKHDWSQVAEEVGRALTRSGFRVHVIKYGTYRRSHYRAALQKSIALVYLGATESQCLAQFEAWACNVPTFVRSLQPSSGFEPPRPQIEGADQLSAAPYLSSDTGNLWRSVEECLFQVGHATAFHMRPRQWVMANASLNCAAESYFKLVNELTAP